MKRLSLLYTIPKKYTTHMVLNHISTSINNNNDNIDCKNCHYYNHHNQNCEKFIIEKNDINNTKIVFFKNTFTNNNKKYLSEDARKNENLCGTEGNYFLHKDIFLAIICFGIYPTLLFIYLEIL
jgi:hypothetical protein